jgi:CheY-like chemotaxis protein
LVYGIVSNHGGGVAISSQPGGGTSARIYLPAEKTRISATAASADELRGTGTVLVVDDEELVLTMAETILADFGYKVLTAGSGAKALAVLSQPGVQVNLVITDLVMPGMGGRELAERIHQLNPHLPVMSTSGFVMPEDQAGLATYLQKPFTSTELLCKVKLMLTSG